MGAVPSLIERWKPETSRLLFLPIEESQGKRFRVSRERIGHNGHRCASSVDRNVCVETHLQVASRPLLLHRLGSGRRQHGSDPANSDALSEFVPF